MGTIIKGGDLMLFVGGKSIAFATSHSLSISGETTETSNKDAGGKWQTSEVNILSWSGQSENLYSADGEGNNFDDLFDIMLTRQPVTAVFALKSSEADNVPTGGWTPASSGTYTGQVFITSLEANAPNGENATFTVQFTGTGALTKSE